MGILGSSIDSVSVQEEEEVVKRLTACSVPLLLQILIEQSEIGKQLIILVAYFVQKPFAILLLHIHTLLHQKTYSQH